MNSNFSYRPDIDGLRALAVLLVIFFHAGFPFAKGGYIGVDVFFVISGFLITLTLDKEMNKKTFSFKQFYLRRIRRIIPVLVFILLIVTIPASIILFSADLEVYSRTLIHTILSTNNFYLWTNSRDYFAESVEFLPLVHTWSLSVEEQFYFLWPPLLLLIHNKLSLKRRLIFILAFLIFGIVLSVYLTNNDQNMAYFLLPARMFELMMGAGLAMFWEKLPKLSKLKNDIISILALVIILVPAVVLNASSLFPGMNAFWPCLGAMLLIFTGKNASDEGLVNKIFKNRVLVFIGLLSYSMYLWHWPLFVFIKYLGYDLEGSIRLFAILSIVPLSYFSWRFVEQPFRKKYKFNFKKTILVVLLPSLVTIGLIYAVLDEKDGFPGRFPELTEFIPKTNFPNKVRKNCFGKDKVGNCDECFIGVKKDSLDGMLIGDSFANHTAAFLDVLAKDAGLYIHDSAAGGYPLLSDIDEDSGAPVKPIRYSIERYEYAKKFKNVFIASNWENLSNERPRNRELVLNTIEELVKLNKTIVLFDGLRATTEMNLHRLKLLKTRQPDTFSQVNSSIPETKRPDDYFIHEIKKRFPSILIIDLNDVMCKNGECELRIGDTIIYRNRDHLNTSGARLMGEKYLRLKGNPLKGL
ncbi:acyltransferase family protein [Flavobacteriaceae bacterium R38]|nr:acyltransferase family protein [Flavobacteriaceae bacterium R38]